MGVQDFGGTGQVIQRGSDDTAKGASPEDLGHVHMHSLVAKLTVKIDAKVTVLRPSRLTWFVTHICEGGPDLLRASSSNELFLRLWR